MRILWVALSSADSVASVVFEAEAEREIVDETVALADTESSSESVVFWLAVGVAFTD